MFCDGFSVTNKFADMYGFKPVLLCDMYCLRTYRLKVHMHEIFIVCF